MQAFQHLQKPSTQPAQYNNWLSYVAILKATFLLTTHNHKILYYDKHSRNTQETILQMKMHFQNAFTSKSALEKPLVILQFAQIRV